MLHRQSVLALFMALSLSLPAAAQAPAPAPAPKPAPAQAPSAADIRRQEMINAFEDGWKVAVKGKADVPLMT